MTVSDVRALPSCGSADAELVAAHRRGDARAFARIDDRHRARLTRYAHRVLGPQARVAEDVVQEALLRASLSLLRDDRPVELRPWLHTLTRNCAFDELARMRRHPLVDAEGLAEAESPAPSACETLAAREDLHDVVVAIAGLPIDQRTALLRRAVDGRTHDEIGEELGVTSVASRGLVHRARAALTRRQAARTALCSDVQAALLAAKDERRRASAWTLEHVAACAPCRGFRNQLKRVESGFRLLDPFGGLLIAMAAVKGTLGASVPSWKVAVAATTAVATAGAGTVVFTAGQPAPLAVRSRALAAPLARGDLLPPGTAVAIRDVVVQPAARTVRLSCPADHVVADLLPPSGPYLIVGFVGRTRLGVRRVAEIAIGGPRGHTSLAILCRRRAPDGRLAWQAPARAAESAPRDTVVVCRAHSYLRRGDSIVGSVRIGQPLRQIGRRGTTAYVETELGERGAVATSSLCGGRSR